MLVKARVDSAPDPAGVAVEEADSDDLRHCVVPGLVIAGDHPHRAVPAALERIAGLSREDLDPAAVEDLHDVFGEGPYQPPVPLAGFLPAGFPLELVVQPDQVGHYRLQDHPAEAVVKALILLVQPVDDRFPVRRALVELGETLLYFVQAPGQLR